MKLLVWFHIMTAIIGIGPTFIMGIFFRKNQTVLQLQHSISLLNQALFFNKIGGPLVVLSGIALVIFGNYGGWLQLWILGSLFIYVVIFATSMPLARKMKAIETWVNDPNHAEIKSLPEEQEKDVAWVKNIINIFHILSILLFSLMILKPVLF